MLELRNVSFEVQDDNSEQTKEIIKNVSLTIGDNEFVAITGPNGGGKSTLARLIMGIERPTSGQILYNGQDITEMSITERAKLGIGFAFQMPVRFKGITVKDLLALAYGDKLTTSEACQYLSEVGLCARDYVGREVNASLSGGELKRIEIATILARKPAFSIFDEPEAGIDLWSFQNLIRIFDRLHKEMNGSIAIISHQERILNIADRIVVIADGEVLTEAASEELLPKILSDSLGCLYHKEVEGLSAFGKDGE
jgi:Fe-S cluster assembly ATP-binding protein